jgi:hypothetical protein
MVYMRGDNAGENTSMHSRHGWNRRASRLSCSPFRTLQWRTAWQSASIGRCSTRRGALRRRSPCRSGACGCGVLHHTLHVRDRKGRVLTWPFLRCGRAVRELHPFTCLRNAHKRTADRNAFSSWQTPDLSSSLCELSQFGTSLYVFKDSLFGFYTPCRVGLELCRLGTASPPGPGLPLASHLL